jgi:PPOX class probable F420-dependent enzyme
MPLSQEKPQELLQGRRIATLATENDDGSIHLTAVWYLFEEGNLFVATSSSTRKARNVSARPKASLMVDVRRAGQERGVSASGKVEILRGEESRALNRRIHSRYMGAEALADPVVGPVVAAFDDVTLRLVPEKWISWDMVELDAQAFSGKLCGRPGYLLPLE